MRRGIRDKEKEWCGNQIWVLEDFVQFIGRNYGTPAEDFEGIKSEQL